jgi:hypothetical protein
MLPSYPISYNFELSTLFPVWYPTIGSSAWAVCKRRDAFTWEVEASDVYGCDVQVPKLVSGLSADRHVVIIINDNPLRFSVAKRSLLCGWIWIFFCLEASS